MSPRRQRWPLRLRSTCSCLYGSSLNLPGPRVPGEISESAGRWKVLRGLCSDRTVNWYVDTVSSGLSLTRFVCSLSFISLSSRIRRLLLRCFEVFALSLRDFRVSVVHPVVDCVIFACLLSVRFTRCSKANDLTGLDVSGVFPRRAYTSNFDLLRETLTLLANLSDWQ